MTYESGDAQDIWEALFVGNRIELSFSNTKEAEKLRVRLYQIKRNKEEKYIALGMMNTDEVQSLIFEPIQVLDRGECKYLAYLGKRKREAKKFMFKIVDNPSPEQE